jgi:hypothetical protein
MLHMKGLKREVVYDLDGSFVANFDLRTNRTAATLVNNWTHLAVEGACANATNPAVWNNAIVCDESLTIRRVLFRNLLIANEFKSIQIKAQRIADVSEVVAINTTTLAS